LKCYDWIKLYCVCVLKIALLMVIDFNIVLGHLYTLLMVIDFNIVLGHLYTLLIFIDFNIVLGH